MRTLRLALAFMGFAFVVSLSAHPRFLCTDSYGNKVALISADGAVEWEYSCEHPQDCWALPDGRFLFCHAGGAIIVSAEKKIVWEYKAEAGTQVHACQPLENGAVLVVENGASRLREIDSKGHVVREISLTKPPASISVHDQFRGVRKLKSGHYLICRKGEHEVEELDQDGQSLRRFPVPGDVHECLLLPNGHFLITCGDGHKVVELDEALKAVWTLNENDIPGNPLRLMAGVQRLPNGNLVFCNYLGHGHLGEQPQCFEITPEKKVVWSFADHVHFKAINQIQLLDPASFGPGIEVVR